MEICHVCQKEKKPYVVFLDNSIFSLINYQMAREDGNICQRCDQYYAMTGEFKEATEIEFENAKKAIWFARMMSRWWQKDNKLDYKDREWEGTVLISNWCRTVLNANSELSTDSGNAKSV